MTHPTLSDDAIDHLHDLIEINVDSAKGFREACDEVKDPDLQSLFGKYANHRDQFANELRAELPPRERHDADRDGSLMGKVHRWWIDAKGSMTDGDRHAILSEVERGEDKIKEAYEEVMEECGTSPVRELLSRQAAQVKATHDIVRNMRDRAKA